MNAIKRLRGLADDIDWHMYDNGGIPRELRSIADEVDVENAKLRELVAGIGHLLFALDVDYCATCPRDGINHPCPVYTVDGGECLYKTDLRELGVEVDG